MCHFSGYGESISSEMVEFSNVESAKTPIDEANRQFRGSHSPYTLKQKMDASKLDFRRNAQSISRKRKSLQEIKTMILKWLKPRRSLN
jgi:hypothetical protein